MVQSSSGAVLSMNRNPLDWDPQTFNELTSINGSYKKTSITLWDCTEDGGCGEQMKRKSQRTRQWWDEADIGEYLAHDQFTAASSMAIQRREFTAHTHIWVGCWAWAYLFYIWGYTQPQSLRVCKYTYARDHIQEAGPSYMTCFRFTLKRR